MSVGPPIIQSNRPPVRPPTFKSLQEAQELLYPSSHVNVGNAFPNLAVNYLDTNSTVMSYNSAIGANT